MHFSQADAPSHPELIDEAELARRLKTTVNSVRWMRRTGRISFLKIAGNRKVRFSWPQVLDDLRAFEAKAQAADDERARQLNDIAASGDEDNAQVAAADLAREFPDTGD